MYKWVFDGSNDHWLLTGFWLIFQRYNNLKNVGGSSILFSQDNNYKKIRTTTSAVLIDNNRNNNCKDHMVVLIEILFIL